jgi:hypothetical protein
VPSRGFLTAAAATAAAAGTTGVRASGSGVLGTMVDRVPTGDPCGELQGAGVRLGSLEAASGCLSTCVEASQQQPQPQRAWSRKACGC